MKFHDDRGATSTEMAAYFGVSLSTTTKWRRLPTFPHCAGVWYEGQLRWDVSEIADWLTTRSNAQGQKAAWRSMPGMQPAERQKASA
jgi:predicted DNA-binding transcriptional regulator AlpA